VSRVGVGAFSSSPRPLGAGHDGAATELRGSLERQGHRVEVVASWTPVAFHIGPCSVGSTRCSSNASRELRDELSTVALVGGARGRGRHLADPSQACAGPSGYSGPTRSCPCTRLASLVLGRMRRNKQLGCRWSRIPTSPSTPLWVHRGVDRHLAVAQLRRCAVARGGRDALPAGHWWPIDSTPVPSTVCERAPARARTGDIGVLVVAGSWASAMSWRRGRHRAHR